MDPLSDVLSLLKPLSYMFGGIDAGGDWAIHFGQLDGINCYAIISGQCWLSVEGVPGEVLLEAGDCVLLPRGWPFRLASDLTLPPVDIYSILATPLYGGLTSLNGGGNCLGVGGYFAFSGNHAGMLLEVLPPIVHIRKESDKAALRGSLERIMQELRDPQPGGFLVAQHLAQLLLVQALRLHLAEGLKGGVGWLFALADRQMSAAIHSMHGDPSHRWTLQKLAERAGMSRSIFAQRFKETVGTTPMEYLTRWRMLLAADKLSSSDDSISVIAISLGYQSESAFSAAFRRAMGCSPRQYTDGRNAPLPAQRAAVPAAFENGQPRGRSSRLDGWRSDEAVWASCIPVREN